MEVSIYRVYLAINHFGRMRQIDRVTRDFFDIIPSQTMEADRTRWYRIAGTSPGRAFTTLWKAAPADVQNYATCKELGARMRLFSNQWYVDARDVELAQAANLNHIVLTWPKALALALALLVLLYFLVMTLYSQWTGYSVPAIQPLARFAALGMLLFLGAEFLLRKLQRWMQETLGVW